MLNHKCYLLDILQTGLSTFYQLESRSYLHYFDMFIQISRSYVDAVPGEGCEIY